MVRPTVAAVAQQQREEVCISAKESFELVRCLLRVSIYHVSFLRGLFPADMFNGATMNNLGGVTVQMLGGEGVQLSGDAQQLKDWVEKGVVDAVKAGFLKKLFFGIASDPDCTTILEEFVFSFQYGSDGDGQTATMRLDATVGGKAASGVINGKGARMISIKQVKSQIYRLMRTLVELCGTLEDVPEQRHIFMRLTYHDDAPEDYEPPYFAPASEEQANASFPGQPFSMKAGGLSTEHHRVSVRIKSMLDGVEPEEPAGGAPDGGSEPQEHADGASGGAGGDAAMGPPPVRAGGRVVVPRTAAGMKGDECDEGGGVVAWGAGNDMERDQQAAPGEGIRREAPRAPAAHGSQDPFAPSQEVDGPHNNGGGGAGREDYDMHPAALEEDGEERCDDGDEPMVGPTGTQRSEEMMEEVPGGGREGAEPMQLTPAPGAGSAPLSAALHELSLGGGIAPVVAGGGGLGGGGGGGRGGGGGGGGGAAPSQAVSEGAAGVLDAVQAHVAARLAKAGQVDKMDVAAKFCEVSLATLDEIFEALVASNMIVQVTGERYARAQAGESSFAPPAGKPLQPPPPALTPRTLRSGRRAAGGAAPSGGGAAGAAFDPFGAAAMGPPHGGAGGDGGRQHVFDASQTSRPGGAKRRKTSICTQPISQGRVPGDGAVAGAGTATLGQSGATALNGSGNRARGKRAGGGAR